VESMHRLIGAMVLVAGLAFGDAGDPPARVARLNYLSGSVSFQPAGVENWTPATLNYPLTTGDHLWVDSDSRAEMHIASTAIHVDANTASSFLNLDDRTVQIRLSQGSIYLRIRYMADDDIYEVDTPNGAISLLRTGSYRIDADPDHQTTTITVRGGEAEVTASGSAFPVHPRQTGIITGTDYPGRESRAAGPPDAFDDWCAQRERREDDRPAARYVSRELPGYEDLDDYGSWRDYPGYGMVWAPRVASGWAPYHYGHWRWIEPWGWTWIDDSPWGFAPFHYGRWAFVGGGWVWVPGPGVAVVPVAGPRVAVIRPVYAPALVAFVGGNNWSMSLSIGGGGGVAWFPLGPREVYVPAYHVSPTYVNRVNVVNVTNVTNVTNITNVTNVNNVRYVNQTVPGAVTAVSRNDFASAQPVQRRAFQVPPSAVATAPVAGTAPAVAPTQQSVAPTFGRAAAAPPASALNRTVMTKSAPPPAPVPFAARQSALAANPGRPVDPGTMTRLQQSSPAPHSFVRPASPPVNRGGFTQPQSAPVTARPQPPAPPAPPVNRSGFGQTQTQSSPRPINPDRPSEAQREQLRQQQIQHPPQPQSSPRVNAQEAQRSGRVVKQDQRQEKHAAQQEKENEKEKERRRPER
jgi:FecR protein